MNIKTKFCTNCLQEKPVKDFRKMKASKDGYQYQCKNCMKPKLKNYYDKNAPKIKQNVYEWRKKNKQPEVPQEIINSDSQVNN